MIFDSLYEINFSLVSISSQFFFLIHQINFRLVSITCIYLIDI